MSKIDGYVIKTQKELDCVLAMREALQDLKDQADDTHNLGDSTLVRYAKLTKCNATKAEKLYRKTAKWRQEYKPRHIAKTFVAAEVIRKYRAGGILGRSKAGLPVFYDRLGQSDVSVLKYIDTKEIQDYEIQKQEVLTEVFKKCSEKEGHEIFQQITVQDLSGLGMHHVSKNTLDLFNAIVSILDKHYPMRFEKLFIVNAPRVFNWAWSLVKHVLSEATKEQIVVVSGDPSKVLLEYIDADQLPKALGGKLVVGGDPYCGEVIIPGGRIPKGFQGEPSHYNRSEDSIPVLPIFRTSIKIEAPVDGDAAEEEEEFEHPLLTSFKTSVKNMTDWVVNLRDLIQNDDNVELVEDDEEVEKGEDDDQNLPALADTTGTGQQPNNCCCIIS